MNGLILLIVTCFLVFLLIFRLRKMKWPSVIFLTIILTCVICMIYIMADLFIFQNLLRQEWKEISKTYLGNPQKVLTTTIKLNTGLKEVFIFSPATGCNAILTDIKATDIYSYNGDPFLIKYRLGLAARYEGWFFVDGPVKWQVYLPPGTLVAGNRIE